MRRRDVLLGLGAAVAASHIGRAEQKPMIGFLRSTAAAPFGHLAQAFRNGLKEAGFADGDNVAIQYRYADGHVDHLPALATELIRGGAAIIVGNSLAAEAAKRLTSTIPIVFVTSDDPVTRGLVANLSHPGGNATGFTFFGGGQLAAKRLEILHELTPAGSPIGFLMDPQWPGSGADLADAQRAAKALGHRLVLAKAATAAEIAAAFEQFRSSEVKALVVAGSPSYSAQRPLLIALSTRSALPTVYDLREYVLEGGLLSYSGSFTEAYRQAGLYAGKILKGANPAELPVQQPTKIELAINLKTAKALGLAVPPALLARADEIIE